MSRSTDIGTPGRLGVVLALACCLLACGEREADPSLDAAKGPDGETLPAPERADGNVTGMPARPGPGHIGQPDPRIGHAPPDTAVDNQGNLLSPLDGVATDSGIAASQTSGVPPGATDGPGPDEAVAVVRSYYGAINARSFDRAYALWSGGGRASGQSPQQFADGFDDTADVSVEFMTPGRIGDDAGSRHIEVPVALSATGDDGSIRRYVGVYTLRHAMVDGASEEQRAWRIASADIREVRP